MTLRVVRDVAPVEQPRLTLADALLHIRELQGQIEQLHEAKVNNDRRRREGGLPGRMTTKLTHAWNDTEGLLRMLSEKVETLQAADQAEEAERSRRRSTR